MNYLLIAALGACTGLRTMTPIAVVCWFAFYHQVLHLSGWRGFTANLFSVIIFTIFALGELIGDKLPKTPSRTAAPGLIARIVFGGFVGLILAQPVVLHPSEAIFVGMLGAVVGTYAGWFVRTRTVTALKCPDWPIALTEDALAIGLSITFVHLVVYHSAQFSGNEGIFIR